MVRRPRGLGLRRLLRFDFLVDRSKAYGMLVMLWGQRGEGRLEAGGRRAGGMSGRVWMTALICLSSASRTGLRRTEI